MQPDQLRLQIENIRLVHPEIAEDNEAWLATLESQTDFNEILTTIVRRIEDTEALIIGTKERAHDLKARTDRMEQRVRTLRDLAFKIMQSADLPRVELAEATLSFRAGTQQLVGERDPDKTPDVFCKVTRTIDRSAVKEHLKSGGTLPGFELSNSPPSLTIRIK